MGDLAYPKTPELCGPVGLHPAPCVDSLCLNLTLHEVVRNTHDSDCLGIKAESKLAGGFPSSCLEPLDWIHLDNVAELG